MPGRQSKIQFETKTIEHCLRHCGNSDIRDILKISIVAAKQAGTILLDRYEKPHHIQHKGSIDIVILNRSASYTINADFPKTKVYNVF